MRPFLVCCAVALAIPIGSLSLGKPRRDDQEGKNPEGAGAKAAAESGNSAEAVAAGSAIVEGRVKLPDAKPGGVKNQRYTVVSKGDLVAISPSLGVAYLEGQFGRPAAIPKKQQMRQKGYAFLPALLAVQTGTTVEFPNEDDTYHNVFSYSKTKRFDLGRYLPTERPVPSQVFDQPGMVQLHCDIHEHMHAVILVLDTPYIAKTDADGRFRLTGLPSGSFKLKVWLSSKQTLEMPVQLTSGGTFKAEFP